MEAPEDSLFDLVDDVTRDSRFDDAHRGRPWTPESAPLAARMRPRSLAEVVGQGDALGPGTPLWSLLTRGLSGSVILTGPPGVGKTTVAHLIAGAAWVPRGAQAGQVKGTSATAPRLVELSAVSSGVKDLRAVIDTARRRLARTGQPTVLFVDEIHRFSATQQDVVLPATEHGWVTLVAATTENPHRAVIAPLMSRSVVVRLQPLGEEDLREVLDRAVADDRGLQGLFSVQEDVVARIVGLSGGDARRALTILELAAAAAGHPDAGHPDASQPTPVGITVAHVDAVSRRALGRYDRAGDIHYEVTSALIKSVRGSDVDAALHYLARMAEGGEDPRFVARRLVILAAEDVGLADRSALSLAVAGAQAVELLGWPEAGLVLAEVVIALALAPKSNAVLRALEGALTDVRDGSVGGVPPHLRQSHVGLDRARHTGGQMVYRYPHDDPDGVVAQQYLPDELLGRRYYEPSGRAAERALAERLRALRERVAPPPGGGSSTDG
jgi:putative ATPase